MRRTALLATSLLAVVGSACLADAQAEPLRLNIRPRSFLDAGKAVRPGSGEAVNPASAQGQLISYLSNPPYQNMKDRFGEGTLPDPITNGPFVGAQNLLGPVNVSPPFVGD